MIAYILRRLCLMVPTMFGIMFLSFVVVQFAPGGPVERMIAQLSGQGVSATARFSGETSALSTSSSQNSSYRGAQGLDPELIAQIERQFGFDKSAPERFFLMLRNYLTFNLGQSYYRDVSVVSLILEKLPVSMSLGLWSTVIAYLISIPLGIAKAVREGSRFDVWSSGIVIVGYAVPGFLFAIFLVVLFAGGQFYDIFPLRGLVSDNWESLGWGARITDYLWHLVLPVGSLVIATFATTTLLTKNAFLDEIRKNYVVTARAKGASQRRVLYGHVFRNAMLIVVAGFPGAFVGAFFTGALLIETIFTLDGLGLLSYTAIVERDYPVVFGTLYVFGLLGLLTTLVSDLTYMWIDPRLDFEKQK